jgi:hypothetical protein
MFNVQRGKKGSKFRVQRIAQPVIASGFQATCHVEALAKTEAIPESPEKGKINRDERDRVNRDTVHLLVFYLNPLYPIYPC